MTITQMRYFLEVCRQETVTRAAESLHISQPSISNAIRELEKEFGVDLFHRVKLRLSLTREGEFFQIHASKLLAELDKLYGNMLDMGNKRNRITLGVPPMIGTILFPSIFEGFHELYPDIELEMVEHGSIKIQEMVLSEDLEIAIAVADIKKDVEFQILPLIRTTLFFSVHRSHPFAGKESVSLEELDGEPIIQFREDSFQTILLNERFQQLGVHPKVLLASGQLYTIKRMIAGGLAGAFLFREVVAQDPDIVGIPLTTPIDMDICLIWKKGRQIFSDTIKFVRFVQQLL